jgi:type IV secretory pathway TrbD component
MLPAIYRIRKDILKIGTDLQTKKIQFVGRACKTAAVFVLQLWILIGFGIHSVNLYFFSVVLRIIKDFLLIKDVF